MVMWWEIDYVKDRRIQMTFFSAVGFAIVVGLYQGIVTAQIPGRSNGEKVAYLIEAMWEAAFFGFGMGFFCVYGIAIKGLEKGILRTRCIGIWLAISYFFMSWWPHASAHQFLTPMKPRDFIILEMVFHWPNLFAALVLCYFQFDVLLISYNMAVNKKELRGWSEEDTKPVPWYKNIKIHTVVLTVLCSAGWAALQWKYNPYPPFWEEWQKSLFITIYIVDGISSGIGAGFAYGAARITHRLPKRRTRRIAALSIVSIAFLLTIATPHPIVHGIVAPYPDQVLVVEYTFHLSITAAVGVLAFFQHRFLVLSLKGRMGMMMHFKNSKLDATTELTSDGELKTLSSQQSSPGNSGVATTDASVSVNLD